MKNSWRLWGTAGGCREKLKAVRTDSRLCLFCSAVETRPRGAVQKAQQRLLSGHQLHRQPHQGHVHFHHLQHHVRAAQGHRDQDGGPQEDLQQRQQDRQDVTDSFPRPLRNLQPGLLGHVPEPRAGGEGSGHLHIISPLPLPL